jgi:4-amino-4-deoxy-L-arabinose transferase-like glycosyltransferase
LKKRTYLLLIEFILIAIIVTAVYTSNILSVEFNGDESQWISSSFYFEKFMKGQFTDPAWQELEARNYQPPLTMYVIGLGRRLGGYRPADLNAFWIWRADKETNIRNGAMPSPGLLWWSRLPMAICAVFSILAGFWLLKDSLGRLPAYAWIGLSLVSSYYLHWLRTAMSEAPLLALSMANLVVIAGVLRLASSGKEHHIWKYLALLGFSGVLTGLAGAAKLNGLIELAAGGAAALLAALWTRRRWNQRVISAVVGLLVLTAAALAAFIGVNPSLWRNPAGGIMQSFTDRQMLITGQQVENPQDSITTFSRRVQVVPQRIFERHASFSFEGSGYLNLGLFLAGLVFCIPRLKSWVSRQGHGSSLGAVFLFGAVVSLPSLLTPLDWDRYYLFPIIFSSFLIAASSGWLGSIWRRFKLK